MSENTVIHSLNEGHRGTVTVCTKEGAEYVYPDMNVTALKKILPENGRIPENMQCLMMVNVSMAILSVPMRIIKAVRVEAEVLWHD